MLVFTSFFAKYGGVINYIDIGARGDVVYPWKKFQPDMLHVIGFEPDPLEAKRLAATHPNRKYYSHALWGSTCFRDFYLCEVEATSSMYSPNEELLNHYVSTHGEGRKVKRQLNVPCSKLDDLLDASGAPHFIKIDTQGAEFEILHGAKSLLAKYSPIVVVETWCAEIYKGAPLTHEVIGFMNHMGYKIFDLTVAAAWRHKTKALKNSHCKPKMIGFDLLFVKDSEFTVFDSVNELLKYAALLELYGFRDYAIFVLERSAIEDEVVNLAIQIMVENEAAERSIFARLKRRFKRIIGLESELWPKLH